MRLIPIYKYMRDVVEILHLFYVFNYLLIKVVLCKKNHRLIN